MPTTHLLYLHGFRSSPQSAKARAMAAHVAQHHPGVVWWCPQLPPSPRLALQLIRQGTASWPQPAGPGQLPSGMSVMGSSLGGFYATVLAAGAGLSGGSIRSVLLNPAVHPARDLQQHIGSHPVWQNPDQAVFFTPEYIAELQEMTPAASLPEPMLAQCMAVVAVGDEMLDWREMAARYARAAQLHILPGNDHALTDFEQSAMPLVLKFLQLA